MKAVYAGRARPQQLLIGNEALAVIASGTGALASQILGATEPAAARFLACCLLAPKSRAAKIGKVRPSAWGRHRLSLQHRDHPAPNHCQKSRSAGKSSQNHFRGRALFRASKEKSLAVWKKYLRGTPDDVLDEAYRTTMNTMDGSAQPSLAVIKSGLDILSLQYPQAKQTDAHATFDASMVRRIEQSGFVEALPEKIARLKVTCVCDRG